MENSAASRMSSDAGRAGRAGLPDLVNRYFRDVEWIDPTTGLGAAAPGAAAETPTLVRLADRRLAGPRSVHFVHYTCHDENDTDWGCCYRCCQMLALHLLDDDVALPSIAEIQRRLVALEPASWTTSTKWTATYGEEKIGTSTWIEPPDVAAYLRGVHGLESTECTLRNIGRQGQTAAAATAAAAAAVAVVPATPPPDAAEAENDLGASELAAFWETLLAHFSPDGPQTPIVVDDVTYAYVIAGVAVTPDVDVLQQQDGGPGGDLCPAPPVGAPASMQGAIVLLFDPHSVEHVTLEAFAGGTASRDSRARSPARPRGCARWVPASAFFWDKSKWMVCLPAAGP
jgi:hypothetical protein